MYDDLGGAMRRALTSVQASRLEDATRQIQDALRTGRPKAPEGNSNSKPKPRPGLGETLETLKRRREPQPGREPAIPDGAAFLKRRHDTDEGGRDYRLYVPATHRPHGLVVMLHGCTQDASDFATGTRMNAVAEEEGFLVAYPTQARQFNSSGCWNWFEPRHQQRARGEPHIIASMTRAIMAEYRIDEAHAFVAGMSAGGAMAAVMSAAYPDLYEAAGIHSGLPYLCAHDVNSALMAMRGRHSGQRPRAARDSAPRTIVFHGSGDHTVSPGNARLIVEDIRSLHPELRASEKRFSAGSRQVEHLQLADGSGIPVTECFMIGGAGHHWSGGDPAGSHTDAQGPDASREMMRFFLKRRHGP